MDIQILCTTWQKAWGAMLRRSMGETVLVFAYPVAVPRLFHTFLCPPMRMIALDDQEKVSFERIIPPNRFVPLPATRIVIETSPDFDYALHLPEILRAIPEFSPQAAGWDESTPVKDLLFALIARSVADMRRVHQAHHRAGVEVRPEVLQHSFAVWERGQIASSAAFLLDLSGASMYRFPPTAISLARRVLNVESLYLDEIVAASVAGQPWKVDFPRLCLRCGRAASWRIAIPAPLLPAEIAWRYQRPENHVLLCHKCAERLKWARDEQMRINLAWGLWGARFEAFWLWHKAITNGGLAWDKQNYPLWPRENGGTKWRTGSGHVLHTDPRLPYGVQRTPEQQAVLARFLGEAGGVRKGRGGDTPLRNMLTFKME